MEDAIVLRVNLLTGQECARRRFCCKLTCMQQVVLCHEMFDMFFFKQHRLTSGVWLRLKWDWRRDNLATRSAVDNRPRVRPIIPELAFNATLNMSWGRVGCKVCTGAVLDLRSKEKLASKFSDYHRPRHAHIPVIKEVTTVYTRVGQVALCFAEGCQRTIKLCHHTISATRTNLSQCRKLTSTYDRWVLSVGFVAWWMRCMSWRLLPSVRPSSFASTC